MAADTYMYGTPYLQSQFGSMPDWQKGFATGLGTGRSLFYDDQDMIDSRKRLEDLQKGYDGKTLGALRESARQNIAGQRQGYLNNLRSNLAKQGVGGARAAAMQGAADQRFAQTGAEAERKLTADNAGLVMKGTQNLNDYLMKQKYGQLATASGFGQLASAQYAADRAASTANSADQGFFGNMMGNLTGQNGGSYLNMFGNGNSINTGNEDADRALNTTKNLFTWGLI